MRRWRERNWTIWSLALLIGTLVLGGCGESYTLRGGPIEPPPEAADFMLTDHQGQPFELSDQRGKVVLLFFGYASCPDYCPATLGNLAAAWRKLGDDAQQAEVAFITVDPEHDSQAILRDYVATFHPGFIGLRGTQQELAPILKAYGVSTTPPAASNNHESGADHQHASGDHKHASGADNQQDFGNSPKRTVDHSTYVYVIDKEGYLRTLYSPDESMDDLLSDVRYLINE